MSLLTLFNLSGKPKKELTKPRDVIGRSIHSNAFSRTKVRQATDFLTFSPSDFNPQHEAVQYFLFYNGIELRNDGASFPWAYYYTGVRFPQRKVEVTELTVWYYRDDALSSGHLKLFRGDGESNYAEMASLNFTGTSGKQNKTTESISYNEIDKEIYQYVLHVQLDPNDNNADIRFYKARIGYKERL